MDTILAGTRKGLFTLRGGEVARVSFLGDPVTAVLSRDGSLFAAVGHGHSAPTRGGPRTPSTCLRFRMT